MQEPIKNIFPNLGKIGPALSKRVFNVRVKNNLSSYGFKKQYIGDADFFFQNDRMPENSGTSTVPCAFSLYVWFNKHTDKNERLSMIRKIFKASDDVANPSFIVYEYYSLLGFPEDKQDAFNKAREYLLKPIGTYTTEHEKNGMNQYVEDIRQQLSQNTLLDQTHPMQNIQNNTSVANNNIAQEDENNWQNNTGINLKYEQMKITQPVWKPTNVHEPSDNMFNDISSPQGSALSTSGKNDKYQFKSNFNKTYKSPVFNKNSKYAFKPKIIDSTSYQKEIEQQKFHMKKDPEQQKEQKQIEKHQKKVEQIKQVQFKKPLNNKDENKNNIDTSVRPKQQNKNNEKEKINQQPAEQQDNLKRPEVTWWAILLCFILIGFIIIYFQLKAQKEYDKNKETEKKLTNNANNNLDAVNRQKQTMPL